MARRGAAVLALAGLTAPEEPWYGLVDAGAGASTNDATSDRHYTVAHTGEMDIVAANGGGLGLFTRLGQNAGSAFQYGLSAGDLNANPSLQVFVREASASTPDTYEADVSDAVGDFFAGAAQDLVTLDQIRLVLVQRNPGTGNLELWIYDPGGAASLIATATGPDGDVALPTPLYLGRRKDGDTDRYWQEEFGGVFAFTGYIPPSLIAKLALGWSPVDELGADCTLALAFKDGAQATEPDLSASGNDAARQGTGWIGQAAPMVADAIGQYSSGSSSTTHRLTGYTLNGDADRALFVEVIGEGISVTSVVLDPGDLAIALDFDSNSENTNEVRNYRLLEAALPAGGDYDVEVTLASSKSLAFAVYSFSGARQSALSSVAVDDVSGTDPSVDVDVGADEVGGWLLSAMGHNNDASTYTPAGVLAAPVDFSFATSNGGWGAWFDHFVTDTAQVETTTWTGPINRNAMISGVAAALNPG